MFQKYSIVLFFLDRLVILDIVIQVVLILVFCGSEVWHMGDVVLRASSVEVNVEFGTCFKNKTEQKMNDGHL